MLPQLTWIILVVIGIGFVCANHGKDAQPLNAWRTIMTSVLEIAILYWGGFFNCFFRQPSF